MAVGLWHIGRDGELRKVDPFRTQTVDSWVIGSSSVNFVPSPISLSHVIEPPCASIACLTIDSPSPDPGIARTFLARKKASLRAVSAAASSPVAGATSASLGATMGTVGDSTAS